MPTPVKHFGVQVQGAQPGLPTASPKGTPFDKLPKEIQAGMKAQASRRRIGFACGRTQPPDLFNVITTVPSSVTCPACRQTQVWLATPDNGPKPKFPDRPEEWFKNSSAVAEATEELKQPEPQLTAAGLIAFIKNLSEEDRVAVQAALATPTTPSTEGSP